MSPPGTSPKYVDEHVAALEANGVTPDVWDVDAQGVPHDLGVLSHYAAVVWYLGDNRLTQDPEDAVTDLFGQEFPDLRWPSASSTSRWPSATSSTRAASSCYAGETAGYYGLGGAAFGGIYYGLDGAPEETASVTVDPFSDCLLLADDFTQYYLGASTARR